MYKTAQLKIYGEACPIAKLTQKLKVRRNEYVPINMGTGIVKDLRARGMLK